MYTLTREPPTPSGVIVSATWYGTFTAIVPVPSTLESLPITSSAVGPEALLLL